MTKIFENNVDISKLNLTTMEFIDIKLYLENSDLKFPITAAITAAYTSFNTLTEHFGLYASLKNPDIHYIFYTLLQILDRIKLCLKIRRHNAISRYFYITDRVKYEKSYQDLTERLRKMIVIYNLIFSLAIQTPGIQIKKGFIASYTETIRMQGPIPAEYVNLSFKRDNFDVTIKKKNYLIADIPQLPPRR